MTNADRQRFGDCMAGVYAMYSKELSPALLEIWWRSLQAYDIAAIVDAFGRQVVNPDGGQFLPKPADIVRMLGGSTLDSAMQALHKFEVAMQGIGSYMTVVFDDPLIHVVCDEMGGWIDLGKCQAKDWEFRRQEFLKRYRGYKMRREIPPFRGRLIGISDGANASKGLAVGEENVRLVGDVEEARRVLRGGTPIPRIGLHRMDALRLEHKA